MRSIPIVVIAFNRPDYLTAVLSSLVQQVEVDVSKRDVFLFQDGAVNPFSLLTHCDPTAPAANLDTFRSFLPHGTPMLATHNLGIALNFDRAERFVFQELKADAAIFLEDDLVLGPYYLKTLEQLIGLALADKRIGYVAAYGNHKASAEQQLRHRSTLTLMGHNWAFGLTRRQWLRQKRYTDQYLDIVRTADYRRRDHDRIVDLFHSWGLGVPGTSQDIAKSHAAILTRTAKVNTYACFGRYIGAKGSHFNPDRFSRMGFPDTVVMQDDIFELAPPDDALLTRLVGAARRAAMVETVTKRSAATASPVAPVVSGKAGAPNVTPPPDRAEGSSSALVSRIRALIEQRSFIEASEVCRAALARFPEQRDQYGHPCFLKEAVRLELARDNLAEAKRLALLLGVGVRKDDPCVHVLFGRHYARAGNAIDARKEALAVLALQPENPEALQWIAMGDRSS